jgi:hypothetical protein
LQQIGQHSVVEQLLNQGLLGVLDACLQLSELTAQSEERIQEDGHTPSELNQQHLRFLLMRTNQLIQMN